MALGLDTQWRFLYIGTMTSEGNSMCQEHNNRWEIYIPCYFGNDRYNDILQWCDEHNIFSGPYSKSGMIQEYSDFIILVVPTSELAVEAELRFA